MDLKKEWQKHGLDKADEYVNDPEKAKGLIEKVKALFSKKGLSCVLEELMLLISFVKDVTTGRYKDYNGWAITAAVAALVYVASPIDAIPDFLIGIGFVDDVAIIGFAMKMLHDELQVYSQWKGEEVKQ